MYLFTQPLPENQGRGLYLGINAVHLRNNKKNIMKFEPVTIKQMARDLNLGISTVSRALHDSHEISEETKKR